MTDKGIKISPKYYKSDWDKLSLNGLNSDWNKAVDIFDDRMKGRFFKQIELLDKNPNRKVGIFAGFAIMALSCLLIETIEQFINGRIRTGQGMDEKAFYDFFQRSPDFSDFFNTQEKADIFYRQIRCGLLHQAQTKRESTIHIKSEKMLQWVDPNDIQKGIKIQRQKFHNEVLKIYENYCFDLRDSRNLNLKNKFKRKMEHIINQN
ncbi:hypothetical protein [Zunongwangia pacifica]|uniref:Uncharacterized protein n=1 Tax=Zunongwangia pacifica TaxID=2911062 RepID=A0A9X1ZXI4_9FLAO|nr:hypothetical protein [Zunongwangia pacifica]MCL6221005.1 hypothetical protein [Zunongwangia pacifica]